MCAVTIIDGPPSGGTLRAVARLTFVLVSLMVALAACAPAAVAAIFVPTRDDDPPPNGCAPSDCSLREAVIAANSAGGLDFISLGASHYRLSIATPSSAPDTGADGDLDVTEANDLFILGVGASQTIIDAGGIDRVFDIAAGARLSMWSVQLRNGVARLDNRTNHLHGGGIHNHGYLGLFWSALTGNFGGNNWGGGGLTNAGNGTAVLSDVNVSANLSSHCGGGIENGGNLTVFNSTIAGNNASPGRGPGIANGAGSTGCFFSGGTARLNNTIVARNNYEACLGTITSLGHNLASDATCGFNRTGDLVIPAPGLQALFDAQGWIWLYALTPGSPAVDAGSGPYDPTTDVGCSPVDQVGTARPQDGDGDGSAVCDIGAHELSPPGPAPQRAPEPSPRPGPSPAPGPPAPTDTTPIPSPADPRLGRSGSP
jgi:hypothetical protein